MNLIPDLIVIDVSPYAGFLELQGIAGKDRVRGNILLAAQQGLGTNGAVIGQHRTFQHYATHAEPGIGTDGDRGITLGIPPPSLTFVSL